MNFLPGKQNLNAYKRYHWVKIYCTYHLP